MAEPDYKPWDGSAPPDGLLASFEENSLSNPEVVGDLVAGFCKDVGSLAGQVAAGDMDGPALAEAIKARCLRLDGLFLGDGGDWDRTTWHTASVGGLRSRATALLASAAANFGDNSNFDRSHPVAGLLYLLAKQCLSAYKAAMLPDPPEAHMVTQTVQLVISTLIGLPLDGAEE